MHHPLVSNWTCTVNARWHRRQTADAMLVGSDTDPARNQQVTSLLFLGEGEVNHLLAKVSENGKLPGHGKSASLIHNSDSQGSAEILNLLPGPRMNRSYLDESIALPLISWRSSETPPVGWEEPTISFQPSADMLGATLEEGTKWIGSWTTDNPIWQHETSSSMLEGQGLNIAHLTCNASVDMLSLQLHEIDLLQYPETIREAPSSQRLHHSGPCSEDCPPKPAPNSYCSKSAPSYLANLERLSVAEVDGISCSASRTSLTANESQNQTSTTIRTPFHQRSSDDEQRMCFINFEHDRVELLTVGDQYAAQPRVQEESCDAVAEVCSSVSSCILVSRRGLASEG